MLSQSCERAGKSNQVKSLLGHAHPLRGKLFQEGHWHAEGEVDPGEAPCAPVWHQMEPSRQGEPVP